MYEWKRLSDFDDLIARGVVIRSPSGGLYEEYVDIIVFDPLDRNRGMGGLIVSGQKAGMYLAIFPVESTEGRCLKKDGLSRIGSAGSFLGLMSETSIVLGFQRQLHCRRVSEAERERKGNRLIFLSSKNKPAPFSLTQ